MINTERSAPFPLDADNISSLFNTAKIEDYRRLMTYYRCAIMEIETKFNVLNEEFSLQYDRNPIESIKSRLKTPQSIAQKLKRKGLDLTVESIENNLGDVAGIRVVCSFPEDVYMLADALLSQDDITLITKRDYIEHPKENGYRSLHLIIEVPIFLAEEKRLMKAEIQLRTIAMDFWASLEHKIRYKNDVEIGKNISDELRLCAEISANLDLKMDGLRKLIENSKYKKIV
ncbi:MAG TPA: GTP pyrophosphokinase family protein [Firmicutes bacterium]|nr:GTP pyrophosphokinase family protein [Bacillota bacterium]